MSESAVGRYRASSCRCHQRPVDKVPNCLLLEEGFGCHLFSGSLHPKSCGSVQCPGSNM